MGPHLYLRSVDDHSVVTRRIRVYQFCDSDLYTVSKRQCFYPALSVNHVTLTLN